MDNGVKVVSRSAFIQQDAAPVSSYTIPAMADILVMYSTYDGIFFSFLLLSSFKFFIKSNRVLFMAESKLGIVVHRKSVQRVGTARQGEGSSDNTNVCQPEDGHAVSE